MFSPGHMYSKRLTIPTNEAKQWTRAGMKGEKRVAKTAFSYVHMHKLDNAHTIIMNASSLRSSSSSSVYAKLGLIGSSKKNVFKEVYMYI